MTRRQKDPLRLLTKQEQRALTRLRRTLRSLILFGDLYAPLRKGAPAAGGSMTG